MPNDYASLIGSFQPQPERMPWEQPQQPQQSQQQPSPVMSDASPDSVRSGQQYAANTPTVGTVVPGGGNTTFVLTPNGWMQRDSFGPVGLMPQGWTPSPVRAPGK